MQSKKPRATRGPKARKRKRESPADPKQRLKPISLHPLEFDEALRRLIRKPMSPTQGRR